MHETELRLRLRFLPLLLLVLLLLLLLLLLLPLQIYYSSTVAILAQAMAAKPSKRPASHMSSDLICKRPAMHVPRKRPAAPLHSASSVHMRQDNVATMIMHSPHHGVYEGLVWMAEIGPPRSSLAWKVLMGVKRSATSVQQDFVDQTTCHLHSASSVYRRQDSVETMVMRSPQHGGNCRGVEGRTTATPMTKTR